MLGIFFCNFNCVNDVFNLFDDMFFASLINKAILCVTENTDVSTENDLAKMVIANLPVYVLKRID